MKKLSLLAATIVLLCGCCAQTEAEQAPDYRVFGFYYNWYGNTEINGKEIHWGHSVIPHSKYTGPMDYIPGGDNLAANYYPQLANYSSTDPAIIAQHMKMMRQARTGVVVVTWWNEFDFGASALGVLMDEAHKNDLKVCFHIEPYENRNPESVRENISTLLGQFGSHPAFYRMDGKPCFFIYDSYFTPAEQWARLLQPDGDITIRGTELDAVMIGLWVTGDEHEFFQVSGMDGFYTYFASTGFTYGSTPEHWQSLQEWAVANGKIFIPCVGPGYIDTRVRPWNGENIRDREGGAYYERMFGAAVESGAPYIGITSFNEWHEGTQIEPAVPFKCEAFDYLDYSPVEPDFYLKQTADLISKWSHHSKTLGE